MRTLYLITARGGSKGVPGKNLRKLGGLSLVGFKARAAKRTRSCTKLVISTDSEEIAEEARRHGVTVPFMRPPELATDTATSSDVIAHAIEQLERAGESYDAIMLLEPSAPFTRAEDYDGAVALFERTGASAVVGMRRMEVSSVYVGPIEQDGRIRGIVTKMQDYAKRGRQQMEPEFTMNGALYLFGWEFFKRSRNIYGDAERTYGYEMPAHLSVEIDEMDDLYYAEFLVERGYIDMSSYDELPRSE
jgi:CMP-N-acetylneuraminic acid synthetase